MRQYFLYENKPAEKFSDAHYLGNGRLGLSVMGRIPLEEIFINEDTLWSGSERFVERPQFYGHLMKVRQLALKGEVKQANNIINEDMAGRWQETFLPLATLHLMTGMPDNNRNMTLKTRIEASPEQAEEYSRTLDLETATETVCWKDHGIAYRRENFVSHPSDCAFICFQAQSKDCEKPLCFALDIVTKLHGVCRVQGNTYLLSGIAPDHCEPDYTPVTPDAVYGPPEKSEALRFACAARVIDTDGEVHDDGQRIYVRNASYAWIAVQARTNYTGFRKPRNKDCSLLADALIRELDRISSAARDRGIETFRKAHLADYQALYGRMSLDLGQPLTGALPTSQRMELCARGCDDPSLSALYLQYARYLTIAGSRPGTQPLNLQGIWNDRVSPPWSSNFTTNINVEMNYWPAEALGLAECHLPLMDMLQELSEAGRQTAEHYYHLSGWTAHHNVDLWRGSEPACEDASWAWWPFGGAWMCQHIWTHYEYTLDEEFLRRMYPVLRGQAEFMLGFLTEDGNGYLVTAPSISPENKFLTGSEEKVAELAEEIASGSRCSSNDPAICTVTVACTMDMSILRELFGNVRAANKILGLGDDAFADELKQAATRFPPYRIGRYGQLLEWNEDYCECSPGMGHISHMYPVYPGNLITHDTPELFEAARRSLERRLLHGANPRGWPGAWRICLEARFGNALECGHIIKSMGTDFGCGMLTSHHQQIDAIFGLGAGIAEMLMSSGKGQITLLPAITADWRDGSFRGMKARGGYTVDAEWQNSHLINGTIHASADGECRIAAAGLLAVKETATGRIAAEGEDSVSFTAKKDGEYSLVFRTQDSYPRAYQIPLE